MPARNHSQDRTSLVPIVLSAIAVFKQNARTATVAIASSQPRDMAMNQLSLICRSSGDRGSGADSLFFIESCAGSHSGGRNHEFLGAPVRNGVQISP